MALFPFREAHAFQPDREGLSMGLDPGFRMVQIPNEDEWPRLLNFHLHIEYCVTTWFLAGMDISMDYAIDSAGIPELNAKQPLGFLPTVTFFPVWGLYFRAGGGLDAYDIDRYVAHGGLGYEWGVHRYGGIGIGLTFSEFFHIDEREHWRIYGISLVFTGYHVFRGVNWDDDI